MSCTHFSHGEAMLTETPGLFQRHLPQVSHRVYAAGSRCFGPSVQHFLFCSTKDVAVQVWQLREVPTARVQRTFVPGGTTPSRPLPAHGTAFTCRRSPVPQFLQQLCWLLFQLGTPESCFTTVRCSVQQGQCYCRAAPLSRVPSLGADH